MSVYFNNPNKKFARSIELDENGGPLMRDIEVILKEIVPQWWNSPSSGTNPPVPPAVDLNIVVISGGLTNKLYLIKRQAECPDYSSDHAVIIRLYGAGTDLIIDRSVENCVFAQLSSRGVGPKFFGLFQNGRVEEFLVHSSVVSTEGMVDNTIYPAVAKCVAALHSQDMDMNMFKEDKATHLTLEQQRSAVVWAATYRFTEVVEEKVSEISANMDLIAAKGSNAADLIAWTKAQIALSRQSAAGKAMSVVHEEVNWLNNELKSIAYAATAAANAIAGDASASASAVPADYWHNLGVALGSEIAFCHNDLLAGNVMLQRKPNPSSPEEALKVILIDYEYAGYNSAAYDLANHFCEIGFAEVDVDVPTVNPAWTEAGAARLQDPSTPIQTLFPADAMRKDFIYHYLVARHGRGSASGSALIGKLSGLIAAAGGSDTASAAAAKEKLLLVCDGFDSLVCKHAMTSCLLWGIWAFLQSFNSTIDFNYISFGVHKLGLDGYYGHKHNYLMQKQKQ